MSSYTVDQFGLIKNPLVYSPFVDESANGGGGIPTNSFLLMDGTNFLLMTGEFFLLMES